VPLLGRLHISHAYYCKQHVVTEINKWLRQQIRGVKLTVSSIILVNHKEFKLDFRLNAGNADKATFATFRDNIIGLMTKLLRETYRFEKLEISLLGVTEPR